MIMVLFIVLFLCYNGVMKREVVLRTAIITVVLVAIFGVIDYFCAIITVSAATSNVNMSATINPSFTLEISANSVALDVVPSASGTFKASSALNVSAYTNSDYNCEIGMTTSNTSLTSTQGQNIYTIPTLTSGSTYTESTFENDSWGYSLDATNYNPVTASNLITTFSSTTANAASVNFAAKLTQATKPGTYSGTVTFTTTCTPPPPPLYDTVAAMSKGTQTLTEFRADIIEPTQSDSISSNSGVYEYNASVFGAASDAASTHKIYYYRGILDSYGNTGTYGSNGLADAYPNYVILDANGTKETTDTCWRIVRTTGSGGIKMIYNGKWTGTTCANSDTNTNAVSSVYFNRGTPSDNANAHNTDGYVVYVGYSYNPLYGYNNSGNTTEIDNSLLFNNASKSNIRTELENWYSDNIAGWTNKLETSAGWCNDRTTYTDYTDANTKTTKTVPYKNSGYLYFGAYNRNVNSDLNSRPTLNCPNDTGYDLLTTSNGLSYPSSLITVDEASFSGFGHGTQFGTPYNKHSYLNPNSYFWTLSPAKRVPIGVFGFGTDRGASITMNAAEGLRPTISLVSTTVIIGGSGIATDPWIVQ